MSILLVEDNAEIRDLLARMVGLLGYRYTAVASSEEALAELEKQTFSILLTDVILPGMSGIELAEHVVSAAPETRIILTTGQGYLLSSGLSFDFTLIPKPFQLRHIEQALEEGRENKTAQGEARGLRSAGGGSRLG